LSHLPLPTGERVGVRGVESGSQPPSPHRGEGWGEGRGKRLCYRRLSTSVARLLRARRYLSSLGCFVEPGWNSNWYCTPSGRANRKISSDGQTRNSSCNLRSFGIQSIMVTYDDCACRTLAM